MSPDLIILIDDNRKPVISSNIKEGLFAHIILAPAPSIWCIFIGLELLEPSHFGLGMEYRKVNGKIYVEVPQSRARMAQVLLDRESPLNLRLVQYKKTYTLDSVFNVTIEKK